MKQYVNKTVSICYYQLRRLKQVRQILGPDIAARLVSAYIVSRLDYCNSLLAGLPQNTIAPLQRVQNAAARLISSLGSRDHITSTLRDLHWLPVKYRVQYKMCLMMHMVHIGRSPRYISISELVTATASLPSSRNLRSAVGNRYKISYAGPVAWNNWRILLKLNKSKENLRRIFAHSLFRLDYVIRFCSQGRVTSRTTLPRCKKRTRNAKRLLLLLL